MRAVALQTRSGALVDDPLQEAPSVQILGEDTGLGPQAARRLAAALVDAAEQAELWALDAAIGRHPAGR